MRTNKNWRLVLVLSLVVLLVLSACAPAATPTSTPTKVITPASASAAKEVGATSTPTIAKPAQTPTPVPATAVPKAATVRWASAGFMGEIGMYVAIEKGYFKEQGITIDITPITTLSDQIPVLAKGDLDIASGGFAASIVNAVLRGVPVKVIADAGGASPPGNNSRAITVRKDLYDEGKIRTAADLKGKRIAITALQTESKFFAPLLAPVGLTLKDIEFVPLSFAAALAAYTNKGIDAAFQSEPNLSQTVAGGLAVQWKSVSEYAPGLQTAVVLASPQFLQNKDVANRWMVAYLKGVRSYLDALSSGKGIDDLIDYAVKYTPLKDKAIYQLMLKNNGFPGSNPDGRANKDSLMRDQVKHFFDEGYIDKMVTVDSLVDESLVDYAVQTLGKKGS